MRHLSNICAVIAGLWAGPATSGVTWKSGTGDWEDAPRWGGSLPGIKDPASIEGDTQVKLSHGELIVNTLDVGSFHQANATLTMTGGSLITMGALRLGEMSGCRGKLVQEGGDIVSQEVGVGALNLGNGDRACHGELEIRGGGMLARHLTLGWGGGSTAALRIAGSKAGPVTVLDYLWIGIREKGVGRSDIDMTYEIDFEGVSPVIVWNKSATVSLVDDRCESSCRLHVVLKDVPPAGDIPLIRLAKPCRGTFTGMPEGSPVCAGFGGQTYEWTLTYRGGPGKTDVVLTNPKTVSPEGQNSRYTAGRPAKVFAVSLDEIRSSMQKMIRCIEAAGAPLGEGTPAFPGAEGYGAYTKGGRGGKAIFVTSLEDSGPGSLREALNAKGPRTVIFRVGGTIRLKSALLIREPHVTIAGQTAPGDGICIQTDSSTHQDGLLLSHTHDVVVRFLRVQHGKGTQQAKYDDGGDCIGVHDAENFIIDHCSTHWGTDETLSVTGASDRYTIQWSIISEGLSYEKHSMASILSGQRSSWHHNLFAHCGSRNPLFAGQVRCDFRNNVIYDWGHTCGYGQFIQLNYVNNYLRPGPSSVQRPIRFISGESFVMPGSLHLAGNVLDGAPNVSRDNWLGTGFDRESGSASPFPMPPVQTDLAEKVFERVLNEVGAVVPGRDEADARVIGDVRNRTGKIVESQAEAGGWPAYLTVQQAPADSDNDGLPDEWEHQHGLNSNDPSDANQFGKGGYTRLEDYLTELAAGRKTP